MTASHHVTAEPHRHLLRVTLGGFFGPHDLAALDMDRRAAHAALRCGPNEHVTLVDVRDLKIQAQDMVLAFRAMITAPATRPRRLAFVVGGSMVRMQIRRLVTSADIGCFGDLPTAEAWLLGRSAPLAMVG